MAFVIFGDLISPFEDEDDAILSYQYLKMKMIYTGVREAPDRNSKKRLINLNSVTRNLYPPVRNNTHEL